MALSINTTLVTDEGFEVTDAFGYLNIFLLNGDWATVAYYKSEADWKAGKQPLNLSSLPGRINTDLTVEEFWGDALITLIHNKAIEQIQVVTGPDTVTIVTTEFVDPAN